MLKKKFIYLFCLYSIKKNTHWIFKSLANNSTSSFIFTDFVLIKNITNQLNVITHFLEKNLKVFYFNENFYYNEITKFNKFILNLFDTHRYNFLFFSLLKLFRKNIFKLKIRFFFKKKRIKMVCFLDVKFFNLIDFFKTLKLVIIGLIPINYNPAKFDFFLPVLKYTSLIKFFFTSLIFLLYNFYRTKKINWFYKKYTLLQIS